MKKLLAAFAVLTFAVVANATDRTGAMGIGYQSSFAGNGQWSVKYGMSSNTTLQGVLGFGFAKGGSKVETATFGARLLYDLVEAENSDFYTGLGIVYNYAGLGNGNFGPNGNDSLSFNIPLGFEFSLANAPAVAFSAEMGATFNYATQGSPKQWNFGTNGGGAGAVFTAGAHYYF